MEVSKKKISIITACYNVYEHLPRCVDSLLKQTIGWENLELIFVDDASTDQTLQYLQDLEQQYPQNVIVIINEENQRMGIARNIAMQYASGKYIGFVDADDWILPEMYETLYQKAEQYQCDITGGRLIRVTQEGMTARGRIAPEENDCFFCIETEQQRKSLLAGGMAAFDTVNVVTKLYRREFIQKNQIHFGEHYAFEDLYFSDLAAYYVKRFAVIQGEYYHYFVHDHSIMTSMDPYQWFHQRKVMIKWLEVCQQRGLLDRYYRETELIFAKDYYISNLHFILTRADIGQEEYDCVEACRKVMWNFFPEISENPYLNQEEYFHTFQRPLIEHTGVPFRRGELQKIQKQYYNTLLSMTNVKKDTFQTQNEQKAKDSQVLHVMIAADRNYLYPALVLLTSLFHNNRDHDMTVYFLQSGFSKQDKQLLQKLTEKWKNKEIHCIEVTEECQQGLRGFGRFSVTTFYRILGMEMIPDHVNRILYLDVDMIVNQDLSELFSMDMNCPLAACYDINNALQGNIKYHEAVVGISEEKGQMYFNAGMLVMDMEHIRKHHVKDTLLEDIFENFELYSLVDQDALNRYYAGKTLYLSWQKYNCPCVPFLSKDHSLHPESLLSYQEIRRHQEEECKGFDVTNQMMQEASVIHFCTSQKPWRDREFYNQKNMITAYAIYERYERLLQRMLPEVEQYLSDS